MKRHVQEPGVRKWSGNDLLDLQSEPLRVVDEFFSQWGDCIICGCTISENSISAGLVSIGGYTLPLAATEVEIWPVYLVADVEHIQREYADDVVRDIARRRFAKIVYTEPVEEGLHFIEVTSDGADSFFDKMRSTWLTQIRRNISDLQGADRTMGASILSLSESVSVLNGKCPCELDHVPGINDYEGFYIGQEVWVVGSDGTKTFYKCHDNAEGAAIWHESGEGSGGAHSGAVFLAGTSNIEQSHIIINQGLID